MKISKQVVLDQLPVYLMVAIFAFLNNSRLSNFFAISFALYCIYVGRLYPIKLQKQDVVLLLPSFLFLIYVFGLIWTEDFDFGWRQIDKRGALGGIPALFFIIKHKLNEDAIRRLLHGFVLLCIALTIVCYVDALTNIIENKSLLVLPQTERDYYYFSYIHLVAITGIDPIYISLYINIAILMILYVPFKKRAFSVAILCYLIIFNFLLASKVGIIGLGVIILLYFFNRMKNKILAVGICAVILGAFVITIYNSKFLRQRFLVSLEFNYESPYNGSWNSVSQRLAIWSCVVETLEPVFPLGYGTGNGQEALNKTYESNKYIRGFEDEYNAHSEFFHTSLETGAFGLVVLLLMILLPLIHAARIQDTLFAIFIIVFCLYFLVDVVFARRPGIFVFSFFFSILAIRSQILTKVHRDVNVQ